MGAYLGAPESMKGPNQENRKGFWENDEVVDINKLVMHTVGCLWDRVVSMTKASLEYRVILFGGLLRKRKRVHELFELLRRTGDDRYKILFVGSWISPEQKALAANNAKDVTVLPPQGQQLHGAGQLRLRPGYSLVGSEDPDQPLSNAKQVR